MTTKKILEQVNAIDPLNELINNPDFFNNHQLIKGAKNKLQAINIVANMRKAMMYYGERESDIYVVSHIRSGTTLTQMVLYQLTTNGSMTFDHLYDVSPWIGVSTEEQLKRIDSFERRVVKSHENYAMFQAIKKGKFVFVIREGLDVVNSTYEQVRSYHDPNLEFEGFGSRILEGWFNYNLEWLRNERQLDIIYINYEDLVLDKENTVVKLASFLNIELSEDSLVQVLERTSFEFMKRHETKFGEQPAKTKVYNRFIRRGIVGEGKSKFTAKEVRKYHYMAKSYLRNHTVTKRYFLS